MKKSTILLTTFILFSCTSTIVAESYFDEAITLFNNQRYEEAKILFEKELDRNNNNAEIHHYLGRTYLIIGNHEKAIEHCENAIELNDDVAEYHFWLGQSLGMKAMNSNVLKQAWLAIKIRNEFEKTIELDSTHIQGRIQLMNYYIQAPSFMGGDIDKATEQAEIVKKHDEFSGTLALAQIYVTQDKTDLAFAEFEHLERQYGDSPSHYYFYNSYGYFLLKQKRYDEVIDRFKKQIELVPNQANPYDSLGDGYRAAGNRQEAINAYRKALEINPNAKRTKKKLKDLEG